METSASRFRNLARAYEPVVRWLLIALVFLLPLCILPLTVDPLEVNKQTLLTFFVCLSALAWLGSVITRRELTIKRGLVVIVPALFLLASILSAELSGGYFNTWIGQAGQQYASVLTTAFFFIFFLLISNNNEQQHDTRRLLLAVLASATLVAIQLTLQLCGVPVLGLLGQSGTAANTIGTLNAAAIFLIGAVILGNGLLLQDKPWLGDSISLHRFARILTFVLTALSLVVFIALDYWVLWVILLVGVALLFVFALSRTEQAQTHGHVVLPMGLFVVALLFLFLPSPFHLGAIPEVTLSQKTSWEIGKQTLSGNTLLFGSGPGSYQQDFNSFRPTNLNATTFWSTPFDRASSHILTLLPTIGLVGTGLFLLFIFVLATKTLHHIVRRKSDNDGVLFAVFAAWSSLVVAMALYSTTMTLLFFFWMLSALLVRHLAQKSSSLSFTQSPRAGLLSSFLFVLLAVGIVTGLFITSQRYAAEIAFAQAVALDRSAGDLDQIIQRLNTAATFNRLSDVYYRNLSQALLLRVQKGLSEENVSSETSQQLLQLTALSINAAKQATVLNPNNVANWTVLGSLYREVSSLDQSAEPFAVEAFTRASVLEPTNPTHPTNLGQSYLTFAQIIQSKATTAKTAVSAEDQQTITDDLTKAEGAFTQAITLKSDYAPAHYQLAVVYQLQGRLADAITKMEAVKQYNPLDVGVAFQLGLLYLRQGKTDLAQAELERAIQLEPTYANARWFLAAIYEQKGMIDKAIEQVSKVAEVNPDNALVKTKLERLQSGQTTEGIPEPIESGETSATNPDDQQPTP